MPRFSIKKLGRNPGRILYNVQCHRDITVTSPWHRWKLWYCSCKYSSWICRLIFNPSTSQQLSALWYLSVLLCCIGPRAWAGDRVSVWGKELSTAQLLHWEPGDQIYIHVTVQQVLGRACSTCVTLFWVCVSLQSGNGVGVHFDLWPTFCCHAGGAQERN